MQQHHEKLLQQYDHKIEEAEILARVVCEQANKASLAQANGTDLNQGKNFKQMKAEIYDVCKLIYD